MTGAVVAGPLRHAVRLFTVAVAAAVLVAVVALVALPRVMGWMPLTVLSGSMEPTIPVGSQVFVEPIEGPDDVARIRVGDVVTFMPRPDDPTLVTHRVVGRSVGTDGTTTLSTQGDASGAPDGLALTERELRGVLRYHVPYAGYVGRLLDRDQKTVGAAAVAGGLLLYAGFQVFLAARDRHPKKFLRAERARRSPRHKSRSEIS